MATDFYSLMAELQAMGVYDYLLPFLLIFTIIFAILEKLMIFGKEHGTEKPKTNINLVISLILGLLVVSQPEITYIINSFLPKVSLFILVSLMFLVIAGTNMLPLPNLNGLVTFFGSPLLAMFSWTFMIVSAVLIWFIHPFLTFGLAVFLSIVVFLLYYYHMFVKK